jgi:hypothetical protein
VDLEWLDGTMTLTSSQRSLVFGRLAECYVLLNYEINGEIYTKECYLANGIYPPLVYL